MMDFELKLAKPNVPGAWISAAMMGFAFHRFIAPSDTFLFLTRKTPRWSYSHDPILPMANMTHALFVSIGITVVTLNIFGFVKNCHDWYEESKTLRAAQTLCVGVLAAATSYDIVRAIDSKSPVNALLGAA
jgi:hypothetical protein